MTYDLPDEIQVEADGPIRVVRLNRPDELNATNHDLHAGPGRAVPAARRRPRRPGGGAHRQRAGLLRRRRLRLHRRAHQGRRRCARETLVHGRQIVTGMVALPACRSWPPSTARPSGSAAASWRCPTSSTWPRAPTSPTPTCSSGWWPPTAGRSPGRCSPASSWPRSTRSPATGSRPSGPREIGLVNHVCPDDEVLDQALACAKTIAKLPAAGGRGHQAHPQPAPRAGGARHARLRPDRRGPLVHLARAAGQPRPPPVPRQA